jgi:hypothetical protein
MKASEVQTATMLRDGVSQLAEALNSRGYQNPAIEVRDSSSAETSERRTGSGNAEDQAQQQQQQQAWENAADNEAQASSIGRRFRDSAEQAERSA